MRSFFAVILILAAAVSPAADLFVFSRDGISVDFPPRELPSVGTRLDTGAPVIGLHAASDATRAACGWYACRDTNAVPPGMRVTAAAWTLADHAAWHTVTLAPIPPRNTVISKYRLLIALDNIGAMQTFLAALAADARRKALWDAAVTLDSTNAMVQAFLGDLKTALPLSDAQADALIREAAAR